MSYPKMAETQKSYEYFCLIGFNTTIQDTSCISSEDVKPGIRTDSGGEKWDLSKVVDEVKYWLEIKSGPNDMDLTQIRRYLTKMSKVEEDGVRGLFGMTYGNLDSDTVTLGLLSRYVEDWEEKVLIGRKLWDFLAGEEGYAVDIFYRIKSVADNILGRVDIISLIDARVEDIINDYNENYENLTEYLNTQY